MQYGVSMCFATSSLQHNLQGWNFDLTITMVMMHDILPTMFQRSNLIRHHGPTQLDIVGHQFNTLGGQSAHGWIPKLAPICLTLTLHNLMPTIIQVSPPMQQVSLTYE